MVRTRSRIDIAACLPLQVAALVALFGHEDARATPNVPLDDPIYVELAALRASGILPPYLGGLRPLSESRVRELLIAGGIDPGRFSGFTGAWLRPLERMRGRMSLFEEAPRPYSVPERPRDIAGVVALSCEHQEGRPCGDGTDASIELDSSGGYDRWVSASIRMRASQHEGIDLDRAYLHSELGPLAVEMGRDVIVLGPSSRTQLAWGDHAPPLDHVRLSTARPMALIGEGGSTLRLNVVYVLGRLRAPQFYPGNLVSIGRLQADLGDLVEVGMAQLLQLAGEGAPHIGLWDFIAEHVRRRDLSAGPTDSSNRRVSFDVAVRVPRLAGARFYYEVTFEDWRRKYFEDAVQFDADHLVGVELAVLGACRHGLTVELHTTGVRSQEHTPRITGLTNGGRIVGSPLGPDADSVFVEARLELGWSTLSPWVEAARLSSDTYTFVLDGPISRATHDTAEDRYRAGARWRLPLEAGVRVQADAMFEHIERFGFDPDARRQNVGLIATVVWEPPLRVGRYNGPP